MHWRKVLLWTLSAAILTAPVYLSGINVTAAPIMHYNITFTILSRKIKGKQVLNRYKYTKFTPQNIALHL